MSFVTEMLITAVYAALLHNLVFTRAFGVSEAVRVSLRPGSFFAYAGMITAFSAVTGLICYPLMRLEAISALPFVLHLALFAAVLTVVYLLAAVFIRLTLGASSRFMSTLGISALNTLVLSIPLITSGSAYTLAQCIGCAVGAGLSFALAAVLVGAGVKKINSSKDVPEVFKGAPAVFLYTALISLAFAGFGI